MATQKHPTGTPVILPDGRSAKINTFDAEKGVYFVKPDAPSPGQTKVRSSQFTEAELEKLLNVPQAASAFTPKDKWPTTRTKATLTLANGDVIEVVAFADQGGLDVEGHEHALIGKEGCILDDHEIRGVTFHSEVVTATVVKETPKPVPAQTTTTTANLPLAVGSAGNLPAVPTDLESFEFISGDAVEGPGFIETPYIQLAQTQGKSAKLGWTLGDIMFADMVLARAEGGSGSGVLGKKAGPIELAVLHADTYFMEDIDYDVQKDKGLKPMRARNKAERAAMKPTEWGWVECVDYTVLIRKPAGYNDPLGMFALEFGNDRWAMAKLGARAGSGSAGIITCINTAAQLYLKGRAWTGKYTLASEVLDGKKGVYAASVFRRVGVWDEATVAGIVEILRGFQNK